MEDIRFTGDIHYAIRNLGFTEVVRKKDFIFPYKNGKAFNSLIFVQQGVLEYKFLKDNCCKRIAKGSLLFIPKNLPYIATYLVDDTHIKIITFDIDNLNNNSISYVIVIKDNPHVEQIFTSFHQKNIYNSLFLASKTYELLYILDQNSLNISKKYEKLIPAIDEIKKQYFKNEKISYYASLCKMSESNFRKLFNEYTGKSPIEFRNLIRISMVKNFLDSGEFTVAEAAYLAGFNNMSFFYEVYNKYKYK